MVRTIVYLPDTKLDTSSDTISKRLCESKRLIFLQPFYNSRSIIIAELWEKGLTYSINFLYTI